MNIGALLNEIMAHNCPRVSFPLWIMVIAHCYMACLLFHNNNNNSSKNRNNYTSITVERFVSSWGCTNTHHKLSKLWWCDRNLQIFTTQKGSTIQIATAFLLCMLISGPSHFTLWICFYRSWD